MLDPTTLNFSKLGNNLLPVVVQHAETEQVLMLAFANLTAVQATLDSGKATFWSRSRDELWEKGTTSGNTLRIVDIAVDCDRDSLLYRCIPAGATCHTGAVSCFGTQPPVLAQLETTIAQRIADGDDSSYVRALVASGTKRVAQKVGEEGVEVALAAVAGDRDELLSESADLLFHLLVLLRERGASLAEVVAVLQSRAK